MAQTPQPSMAGGPVTPAELPDAEDIVPTEKAPAQQGENS